MNKDSIQEFFKLASRSLRYRIGTSSTGIKCGITTVIFWMLSGGAGNFAHRDVCVFGLMSSTCSLQTQLWSLSATSKYFFLETPSIKVIPEKLRPPLSL